MTIKFPYTRTPKGTEHPLTVGLAADLRVDDEGGKWVVLCDDHGTLVNVDTQRVGLGITALDFCDFCRDEANGVSDMSIEFAKDEEADAVDAALDAVRAAVADGDLAARDTAILAGRKAGITRVRLAEAAGLVRVGRILRKGGLTTPRTASKVSS